MKKALPLALCLILLVSTGITAAASVPRDGALDERLKAITLSVKETLGIGDTYTSFDSALNEYGTVSLWDLNWSGDKGSIHVTANESGKIVRYREYVSNIGRPSYENIPRYPKISADEAKSEAAAFLDKVLDTSVESAELQGSGSLDYSGSAVIYLNGPLKLNGVETPVNVSVSVNAATKKVTSFSRSDAGQDYSGAAKPGAASDRAAAAATLKGTLSMKLRYALPGDGTRTAKLQYTPNPDGNYIVNAVTGELLDLNKLDWSDGRPGLGSKDMEASASAAPSEGGLTPIEQAAVDKLQGVLTQSELEGIVRGYPELGLTSGFVLRYLNYYAYEDENEETQVTASMELSYVPESGTAQYRYLTMDARTGKLLSLSSSRLFMDGNEGDTVTYKYTTGQAETTARSFAGKILPEELKRTALASDSTSPQDGVYGFLFNRTHDGIAFPENYIRVGVDTDTGFVVSFYANWYKYDVTFVSSEGAVSADDAAEKYSAAAGTALRYVSVPTATDASGLLLAYTAENTSVWGVDAISGEALRSEETPDDKLEYNDIESNPYAAAIKKLASFGVGFPGGSFKPDAQLTQEDALTLILSAAGRKAAPLAGRADVQEELYNHAYSLGILTPEEKDPERLVSRAEFVKYLVNGLGYKDVAILTGIFKPGFKDDKAIPADLVGYVAIARGIGIINGDQNGYFKPNMISTRIMAAIMLSNCLSRK